MSSLYIPFDLPGFAIDAIQAAMDTDDVLVQAHSTSSEALCPYCGVLSNRRHSAYERRPQALPWGGKRVYLCLTVQRYFCANGHCTHKTFAERIPAIVPFRGRRTVSLTQVLRHIIFEVSAEVAARIAGTLHIQASADTFLRVIRNTLMSAVVTPRVLGVDDGALKRGQVYGTILVDQERHCVVDLLPDRDADSLDHWLRVHPGVELVSRDRSTEYKAGIDAGAPQATQLADRWHLLKNLRDMLERFLQSISGELQQLPITEAHQAAWSPRRSPFYRTQRERAAAQTSRERRLAQYTHIQQLRRDGHNITQIAHMTGLNRKTVSKYYHARVFPERKQRSPGRSILDPHLPYLIQRFDAGCQNALQLWRELQDQGFTGSSKQVSRWVQAQRTHPAPQTPDKHRECLDIGQEHALPTIRSLAWLLVGDPQELSGDDTAILQHLQQHSLLAQVYRLARQFVDMIQERDVTAFDSWLATCVATPISQVKNFALGLQQDYAAVKAALCFEWSNGQTEGQVNRLKCIKRQMYGRANFDLLRLHVLGPP